MHMGYRYFTMTVQRTVAVDVQVAIPSDDQVIKQIDETGQLPHFLEEQVVDHVEPKLDWDFLDDGIEIKYFTPLSLDEASPDDELDIKTLILKGLGPEENPNQEPLPFDTEPT